MKSLLPGAVALLLLTTALHAETLTFPASANAGISSVRPKTNNGRDMDLSWGSGETLAIRQNQNWSGFENKTVLLKFDLAKVKGWNVKQAFLHFAMAKGDLYGVGLCSVLNDWREPTVDGKVEPGAPCWNYRATPPSGTAPEDINADNLWAWPDSGLYSVAWLNPGLRYSHSGPDQIRRYTDKDGNRWIRFPVDPLLVAAMSAGVSYGVVITDDKGQVAEAAMLDKNPKPYSYDPAFEMQIYSRHAKGGLLAPKLEVTGELAPVVGPETIKDLDVESIDPLSGAVSLWLTAPADKNGNPALAYFLRYFRGGRATHHVPRFATPLPGKPGTKQVIPLVTLPPGPWRVTVQTIDAAGNPNTDAFVDFVSPDPKVGEFPKLKPHEPLHGATPATEGKIAVWAENDLAKIDPLLNTINQRAGDLVSLNAARNEVVSFQLVVQRQAGDLKDIQISMSNLVGPENTRISSAENIQLFREYYFHVAPEGEKARWIPDACIPLTSAKPFTKTFSVPGDNVGAAQINQAVWVDIYVPKDALPGAYDGRITVTSPSLKSPVSLNVALRVRPFALPDEITFPVELNTYSGIGGFQKLSYDKEPERLALAERRYYQMAQAHRLTFNILRYSHSGKISEKGAPPLDGDGARRHVTDWTAWDKRVGPLLDGTAFSKAAGYSGPGENTPVAQFYLPVFENWPMDLDAYYKDKADFPTRPEYAEWAKKSGRLEETIDAPYVQGYTSVVAAMMRHFADKKWTNTNFQFFLNNKYYFKCNFFVDPLVGGQAKPGGKCYWLLDEPVDFDDFDANRYFLNLAHKAVETSGAKAVKVQYRTDVSNPHMARGLWDGVCDLWDCSLLNEVASTAFIRQRVVPGEKWWNYGGGIEITQPSVAMDQAFLNRYTWGCTGYLPYWKNFGDGNAWKEPSGLSIYYSGDHFGGTDKTYDGPIAGLRMKILRRAQQDIEYLNVLASSKGWNRDVIVKTLAKYSDDHDSKSGFTFSRLGDRDMNQLRESIAAAIEESLQPEPPSEP